MQGVTYGNGSCLSEEADQVEPEFAVRGKRNSGRDHEDNHSEFAVGLLNAERPGNEKDGNRSKGLKNSKGKRGSRKMR